jgi:hypothetical protein
MPGLDVSDDAPLSDEDAFIELIRDCEDGDQVLLYDGPWDSWRKHPFGVIVIRDGVEYLNDGTAPFTEKHILAMHEWGRVSLRMEWSNDRWELNLPADNHVRTCDVWVTHPCGIILQYGARFVLVVHRPFRPDRVLC